MFKITKTYKDYDGNEITNDFYFSMSKPDLLRLNFSSPGGLVRYITSIQESNNGGEIIAFFEKILAVSYGRKIFDPTYGTLFQKKPEFTEQFVSTPAYAEIYMDLATNAQYSADFIKGVVAEAIDDVDDAEFEAAMEKAQNKIANKVVPIS